MTQSIPTLSTFPRRLFLLSLLPLPALSATLPRDEATFLATKARLSLPRLSTLLELQEYDSFRRELRNGPLGRIRVSCTSLLRTTDDIKKVEAKRRYDQLIKKIEGVDFAALSRERGIQADVGMLMNEMEMAFDVFLETVGVNVE